MIKVKISREKSIVKVKGSGTPADLCVETAIMIEEVYRNISATNPEAAKLYKTNLLVLLLDPESPVGKGVEG